jgi:hypothetical protein
MEYDLINCTIGDHNEQLIAYVASIGHYPLVLGIPSLKKHDVNINFAKMGIQFLSPNCLPHHTRITPAPIKGILMARNNKICTISATSCRHIVNNANNYYGKVEQFALLLYEINTVLAKENNNTPDI